ncbi:type II toxin-antitoxin system VapC family toxin [Devosia sp.]|uniref:type II toxin-antitoxin system VapC family toxin n=1 Tax=Devosia sp. TaxID=1871048 RepID=UPI0035B1C829
MTVVLDASALLAVMNSEPGQAIVRPRLEGALISSVNLAEVGTRLCDGGDDTAQTLREIAHYGIEVVPFDARLAAEVILLRPLTRHAGLSLGDRACLALAIREKATALTADRAWAELDVGCPIELIR